MTIYLFLLKSEGREKQFVHGSLFLSYGPIVGLFLWLVR